MAFVKNIENAKLFVKTFRAMGYPDNFISGLGGNWVTETAHSFEPNQVQLSYLNNPSYGIASCDDYVKRVDNGTWHDIYGRVFGEDKIGFGYSQLTSSGRKTGYYNYCKSKGYSVGDSMAQFEWADIEIHSTGYANVRKAIKENWSIEDCARVVCTDFERPAKKDDIAVQNKRIEYALQFYEEFVKNTEEIKEEIKEDKIRFTNSPLADFIQISPNKDVNRKYAIDTIIIHAYVGQVTVERMGKGWQNPSANASANYGIGLDGRIGLYVDEKDRAWTTGGKYTVNGWTGSQYDHRAVTIECACDTTAPYAINDAVMKSLIRLCADICQRNGIKELKWKGDKNLIGNADAQNLVVHRWFTPKACPGDYIYNRLSMIASDVNELLGIAPITTDTVIYHTVVKGETLTKIANAYGTTVASIVRENGIMNPNVISVGQILKILTNQKTVPVTYTVVKGDTLSKIAKANGITLATLKALNPEVKGPLYIIRVGQVLKIR